MSWQAAMLTATALAFAIVSGRNDGGTLSAIATRSGATAPAAAVLLLSLCVITTPALLGTAVATTFLRGLVGLEGSAGQLSLLAAGLAAMAVVWLLSSRGLPTSMTLALMGAMVGAGLGSGFGISWGVLARVLLIGLAAPVVSSLGGSLVAGIILRLPPAWARAAMSSRSQHVSLALQCVAYSANDAQKMTAIAALAPAAATGNVAVHWPAQLGIGGCFAVGAMIGTRQLARRVAEGMVRVRPINTVSVELAAACVVLGSAAVGAPISSTQAVTTALVGSCVETQRHRLRWQQVVNIAGAWALTLPVSAAVGLVTSLILVTVT